MTYALWLVCLTSLLLCAVATEDDHARLKSTLLEGYRPDTRPVLVDETRVNITVVIGLRQILNMDMRNEIITTRMDMLMRWEDELLKWDPSDYGGIQSIHIYAHTVWTPDIIMYNEIKEGGYLNEMLSKRVRVYHNGLVHWPSPITAMTSCPLDMRYFPWDEQLCTWQLGSWIYPLSEVDLVEPPHPDNYSVNYVEHGEWELLEKFSEKLKTSEGIDDKVVWPTVTFSVRIKRRPLFFLINMIMPSMMITVLSLLAFCVPTEEGEKITVSFTILLASAVFLLVVNDIMPVQSYTVPLISEFYIGVLSCLALSTVATVFVTSIYHKGNSGAEMSPSVRKFTHLLSTCFCLASPRKANNIATTNSLPDESERKVEGNEWSLLANCLDRLFIVVFSFLFLICFTVTLI